MKLQASLPQRADLHDARARWLLLGGLAIAWSLDVWGRPCSGSPNYLTVVLGSASILLVLWSNHVRRAPLRGFRDITVVVLRSLWDLLMSFSIFLLIALPLVIVLPTYDCYTTRSKVSEALILGQGIQEEIAERVKQNRTLLGAGKGVSTPTGKYVESSMVTDDGTVILNEEDPPLVVIFVPKLTDGTLSWDCYVRPDEYSSRSCRH